MKKLSLALATILGLGILSPATAEAGGCRSRVHVDRCGYTVYTEYRYVGRDCHGCPRYEWVVVRRVPPCDHGYDRGGYRHSGYEGHYHGGRGGYYPSRPSCGTSIHFSWGR
jgi:hypothetical protein